MLVPKSTAITRRSGLSLIELLTMVAAIGIIAAIAIPSISNIREAAIRAAAEQNAKNIEAMSEALASLGVAHVIPESMGGVEATGRLLREGVIVPDGPMAGETFILSGLSDKAVKEAARYLVIEYDKFNLRLHYSAPEETSGIIEVSTNLMLCFLDKSTTRLTLCALTR